MDKELYELLPNSRPYLPAERRGPNLTITSGARDEGVPGLPHGDTRAVMSYYPPLADTDRRAALGIPAEVVFQATPHLAQDIPADLIADQTTPPGQRLGNQPHPHPSPTVADTPVDPPEGRTHRERSLFVKREPRSARLPLQS